LDIVVVTGFNRRGFVIFAQTAAQFPTHFSKLPFKRIVAEIWKDTFRISLKANVTVIPWMKSGKRALSTVAVPE
jgi:hypothetical protein